MNYLSVEGIAKAYGEKVLFEDISFGINKDQKIAFVAKNGSGKTSILNIVAGVDTADAGQVVSRKDIDIAYLSQADTLNPDLTIEETIFSTDNKVLSVIKQYEKAVENPENADAFQEAFELMEQYNAWDFETQYTQILSKLKLDNLQLKVGKLSGGQKKRLALAIVLIKKPDLLILDEPTNHLDLEMIEWLEAFFAKEKITLFMVTHDRYFLERVCNEIIELDNGQLYKYKGNYSYYLQNKEERLALEATNLGKAKSLFKKELDWMRRQPKARTTKSKSRTDDFYEIKEKAHKRRNEHEVQLEINMERLGSKILELHKMHKSFDDKVILNGFDYVFKRGERIGIIGKNGTGKSSFLNMLTGGIELDSGKVTIGETVKFGYYTQNGIVIKPGQKVIEVVKEFGEYIPLSKGRKISASQLLERFLFDRKKQYDFVEKLSGGEQKRLYLCAILIQNPNFLILDEPTNDLDVVTLNVLENFLLDFPGNLMVVSHDRYFMDKIVDNLFVFRGDGVIDNFPGNYSDFRTYEDSKVKEAREVKNEAKKAVAAPVKSAKKVALSFDEKREWGLLEKDIEKLQKKKQVIETKFMNVEFSADEINDKSKELQEIIEALETKEERWFELSMKIEGE
ncbi:ABC-F family ATP-binding cassette domain-containing protein [Tenacibaculum finnmarkense genomovar finnmarkense]|uniref:ATP-binding cassette domain-containing protein n=1 Tax=Tenacibaculum finnmarkense genomovar finnmarkense TaxID=1458503 RepID=A0AAP1RCN6_9FLAO|nr:ABC-F family ATP-binding cassette domain-containing protein [Tenacibaculum finnmarkense]MBE7651805.1 ATP-binding cassette domain-containing protein [Tenacibaculum finnmarkense genomovar finnmarkense]MBE7692116.1 ATP-binding cassette domain-containing protein [Tenacibaculum finnmarkense genomovar finnmarkense]MBE7693845.1 ATP-binding cassette domain-containing protein [Tenacibaculum finnmarkense genomovar finnmarkense]MCD8416712.1 ABC-F family ATP-binding cassette domain-containing protein [T